MSSVDPETLSVNALRDHGWHLYAPCGCLAGVHVAHDGWVILGTPASALQEFYPRAREREKKVRQGWTVELHHRSDLPSPWDPCEHEPRWTRPDDTPPSPVLDYALGGGR